MTTTIKLNPKELLSRLASSNSSGCLELEEGLVSWKVYLQEGNLKYIYCSAQLLDHLKDYLYYLGLKQALVGLQELPSSDAELEDYLPEKSDERDYYSKVLCWLRTEKHLDSSQCLKLIEHITRDSLRFCLWLDRGRYSWHNGDSLPLWIKVKFGDIPSLNLSKCLELFGVTAI